MKIEDDVIILQALKLLDKTLQPALRLTGMLPRPDDIRAVARRLDELIIQYEEKTHE